MPWKYLKSSKSLKEAYWIYHESKDLYFAAYKDGQWAPGDREEFTKPTVVTEERERHLRETVEKGGGEYVGILFQTEDLLPVATFNEPETGSTLGVDITELTVERVQEEIIKKQLEKDFELINKLSSDNVKEIDNTLAELDRIAKFDHYRVAQIVEKVFANRGLKLRKEPNWIDIVNIENGDIVGYRTFDDWSMARPKALLFLQAEIDNKYPALRGKRLFPLLYRWMPAQPEFLKYSGLEILTSGTITHSAARAIWRSGFEDIKVKHIFAKENIKRIDEIKEGEFYEVSARFPQVTSESLFCTVVDDPKKLPYIKVSVLQSLMNSAIEKVQIDNNPTIERAFCIGSGLSLAKDGLIRLDKIRDLDMVLIFTQPTHNRNVIKQKFIEELANVLDDRSIGYRFESISSRALEAAAKYGLKSGTLAAQKSLLLVTPSGDNIGIDIDSYGSPEIFLDEQLISLKDQLQSDDLLSQDNPEIVLESEQHARFIKRYLEIEYLIGDLEKYTKYREAFLDTLLDKYKALRKAMQGELSRLREIFRKSENYKLRYMLWEKFQPDQNETNGSSKRTLMASIITQRFPEQDNISFVDLDTGTGEFVANFINFLKKYFKEVQGIGIESEKGLAEQAHGNGHSVVRGISHIIGDYEKVGLVNNSRDIVTINNIEKKPWALIAQADRIVKENGLIVVSFEKYDIENKKENEKGMDNFVEEDLKSKGYYVKRISFPVDYPRSEEYVDQSDLVFIAWKGELGISDEIDKHRKTDSVTGSSL